MTAWIFAVIAVALAGCVARLERKVGIMSAALDALKQRVQEIDERDDAIAALVEELKTQVAALQQEVAGMEPEIQAAADKLAESVGKFDGILNPPA
jgi:outer membrane murein-binding lipoprotein Lpp